MHLDVFGDVLGYIRYILKRLCKRGLYLGVLWAFLEDIRDTIRVEFGRIKGY